MPPLDLPRRDAEIIDAVGRLHIGKAVVERLPLVRDELLCHIADAAPEQLIRNADLARFKRLGIVLHGETLRFFGGCGLASAYLIV